jgi:hypothetical protein
MAPTAVLLSLSAPAASHGHGDRDDRVLDPSSSETMVRMLHNEPALSELFMSYLLSRNVRIEEDLVDHCSIPARSGWLGFCCC